MMRRGSHYINARDDDLRKKTIEFLKAHPNPTDELVHEWAEDNGIEKDEAEAVFYRLATKFVKLITEGRSQEKGITEKDVPPEELKKGIDIEKEHIDDEEVQKKIALDHLAESHDYYKGLDKMEKELEKED